MPEIVAFSDDDDDDGDDAFGTAVAGRLEATRARIVAAGGDLQAVTIVAVTKGFGPEAVRAALHAGLTDIGENYAAEVLAKAPRLEGGWGAVPRWHFLGALQRNKIPRLAPIISCWQSVSRPEEALAIARRSADPEIFVEVDATHSAGRPGCDPAEAPALVEAAAAAGCRVRGLMTIAPLTGPDGSPERERSARDTFGLLARLASRLGLEELSMGMSADLEVAVEAGSTMVRVGTALFGERPQKDPHTSQRGLQQ